MMPKKEKRGRTLEETQKANQLREKKEHEVKRNQLYRELRIEYLARNPDCEVCLRNPATQIHHRARRSGYNLFRFFLGVCQECHTWVHNNGSVAKQLGYIIEFDPRQETIENGDTNFDIPDRSDGQL